MSGLSCFLHQFCVKVGTMMRKVFVLLLIMLIGLGLLVPVFSQTAASKVQEISMPFGEGEAAIGMMPLSDGFWAPMLFDVGRDGKVYVPDFYHERIVCYSANGTRLQNIPVPDLNPRLRFFKLEENKGLFVFMCDQTVFCYSLAGKQQASRDLGLVIPDFVWLASGNILLVVRGEEAGTLVLDYGLNSMTQQHLQVYGRRLPILRDTSFGLLTQTIGEYKQLGKTVPAIPDKALLVAADKTETVWMHKAEAGLETYYMLSSDQKLTKQTPLQYETTHAANGFCTVVAADRSSVYKLFQVPKGISIRKYRLR